MNPTLATIEASSQSSGRRSNGKPKRPLSAYNLYFQVERARILKFGTRREQPLVYLPDEVLRMSQWHKVRPRRPHRKSHGRVSFQDMARIITARWKDLDQRNRQVFVDQAKLEKADYKRRVQAWEAGEDHQSIGAAEQQYEKASSMPQREQATALQHIRSSNIEEELRLEDLAAAFPPMPNTTLSFQTSTSSLDSLESVESLNLMNDDFFEVEISAEFHAEMATIDRQRAFAVPSAEIASQPDCAETDASSSIHSESQVDSDADPLLEFVVGGEEFSPKADAVMSLHHQHLETSPKARHSITVVNKMLVDGGDNLADVLEADLMDALLLFDN